jgi:hypothetical protein
VDRDGIEFDIQGKVGDNLMMLAQLHDVDIEGDCSFMFYNICTYV